MSITALWKFYHKNQFICFNGFLKMIIITSSQHKNI